MKSLKTFNLDKDVIDILASKPNKSQFVCRAVRRLDKQEHDLDVHDANTRTLAIVLKYREEIPQHIRRELETWLRETA